MSQESYIQILCKEREVDTDLELEIHKLYDHKKEFNDFPVRDASRVIDKLRACPKKEKVA
jgi:DNA-directed RNA polymerase subunit F